MIRPARCAAAVLAALVLVVAGGVSAGGFQARAQTASPAEGARASVPADSALRARTFTIRYRDIGDVVLLIQPVLSEVGSFTVHSKLRTVSVQDTEAVLSRIEDLIRSFDVPPRNVEVDINLLVGSRKARPQRGPRELRGIINAPPPITKWDNYQLLDSVSITGSEGAVMSRTLSGEEEGPGTYRIELGIQSVDEDNGVITVDPFRVDREYASADRAPVWRPVYATKLNLRVNRTLTIAAARSEKSEKALFLMIRARVTE